MKPPAFLQVELTNHCNLSCPMCPHQQQTRQLGHMSLELALDIIKQSTEFRYPLTWFHAFGEPLLYPHLKGVLEYFYHHGYGVGGLSTNGLLLDEAVTALLKKYGKKVLVALDSTRPDVYRKLRANEHFERVRENINRLIRETAGTRLEIGIQFLRTRLNEDESVEEFERIFGRHPHVMYVRKRTVEYPRSVDVTASDYRTLPKEECDRPYWQMSILYDGSCTLCCWDYDAEQSVGNVNDTSLADIWKGRPAERMRQKLKSRDFGGLPLCGVCAGPHDKQPDDPVLY